MLVGVRGRAGVVDSETLRLEKCPECGLLVPVGAEHVCDTTRADAKRRRRNYLIVAIAIVAALVAVGSETVRALDEQRAAPVAATTYWSIDYNRVAVGMTYREVATALGQQGEVQSRHTDSQGEITNVYWRLGHSLISVYFDNGIVDRKAAYDLGQ